MRTNKYILLIMIFIGSVTAQQFNSSNLPKIGVLRGTVTDSISGQPLQYASVSIFSLRTNELVSGGITDEDGRIFIEKIPLGQYKVSIEYIGYKRTRAWTNQIQST